jgi:F-type H+-transporting ATPase subunit a
LILGLNLDKIIPKIKIKFLTFAALFSKINILKAFSMVNRLIFSFLFSVIFSFFASASSEAPNASSSDDTTAKAKPSSHSEANRPATSHDAHSKTFDPVGLIMHHIADANEFHVLGHTSMPLPVIIYNKDKKNWFTTMSSAFHAYHGEGTVDVHGYKMEQSRIHPLDGSQIIDFSITKNVFGMLLGLILLLIVFFLVSIAYSNRVNEVPKGFQSLMEPLIQFVAHDIAKENIGKNYLKFVPFLVCIFFFILINNLLGLIPIFPGSANISGNISFTFALGFLAFIMINVFAKKDYWGHIFVMPGVPKALLLILTPIEVMGIFIKPIALMLRLFGNITGGHIAILSIASMVFILGNVGKSIGGSIGGGIIAIPLLIFVNAMELFVAFLQAYVFTLLTSIFIGIAQEEHSHADHH